MQLAALYIVAAVLLVLAVVGLFIGHDLVWVIGLACGVTLLLIAHRIRTGRGPWARRG